MTKDFRGGGPLCCVVILAIIVIPLLMNSVKNKKGKFYRTIWP